MRDVSVIGIGQVPVGDLWEKPIYILAVEAMLAAIRDSNVEQIDSVYIGNMLSSTLAGQDMLASLAADQAGLTGVEAVKVEAACSSGGVAFREGYLAVASGHVNFALVCGVEKMLDHPGEEITEGLVSASDADWESAVGDTFVAINARLMQRYMYEYGIRHEDFAPFPINAHHNAVNNPNAMLRYELSPRAVQQSTHDRRSDQLAGLLAGVRWRSGSGLMPDRDRAAIQPVPDQGARQRRGNRQPGTA